MKLDIQKFAVTKSTTFAETNLNPSENTSTLKITIKFSANNTTTYFSSATLRCTCNGVTQSKTVSHPLGGGVEKTFTFNDIEHNADGTKTVSWSWSCATGTNVLGTQSASGTRALTTLHTPPKVNTWTMTETNPKLLNIGIPSVTYVKDLSQIKVEITDATYYDNAVFKSMSLYQEIEVGDELVYNKFLDLVGNPAYFTPTQANYDIWLGIKLFDSKNGSSTEYREIKRFKTINYLKPTINGSTKRVGQTSGQVSLSCFGNYYNGDVGNKIQSGTYKPTIKYKFWETGQSEPSWDDVSVQVVTINTNDITTNNGTFEVSNLNIGSTIPGTQQSGSYYFDYQKSYRLKIQISDNFVDVETQELSITVGIPVWSEYPDHVNFERITRKDGEIYGKTVLFEDDSGETGNITLSDNASNYDYLEIYYRYSTSDIYGDYYSKISTPNGNKIALNIMLDNNSYCYLLYCPYSISGTTMTKGTAVQWRISTSGNVRSTTTSTFAITKVVGYR